MTPEQKLFLDRAAQAATMADHPFPRMAAAEAALESAWGTSLLAIQDCNLFGMKQHLHPEYGTASLPTKEFELGKWITVESNWIHYPNWPDCFHDRLTTLVRLSHGYPHYAAALRAPDAQTYIREVSQSWSTDPQRADKCLAIYTEYVIVMA